VESSVIENRETMICKIADNIYSPLGTTTAENFANVKQGRSALRSYAEAMELPEPFTASLFDWDVVELIEGYTHFESIVIQSVKRALQQTSIDAASPKVLFVISTTKGNVELLDTVRSAHYQADRVLVGTTARLITSYFKNPNPPVVVSNACISGLCAQITAMRALESGCYDTAIVVGADVQSRFIISGFESFKALSHEQCRPFDLERVGLNLGEAAATIIYNNVENDSYNGRDWQAVRGAVRNDAYHISSPSRKGEGCYRALRAVMQDEQTDDIAFINVHGTSTLYNDEMESAAIDRAGMLQVPVNSLKGHYGHTMGAAGVLETVLSMKALDEGIVLGTHGFESLGVSHPVNISAQNRTTDKQAFVKLLSGFGGCNAAMLFRKGGEL